MILVFEHENLDLKAVRHALAASVVWECILEPLVDTSQKFEAIENMKSFLGSESASTQPEDWAITVYATFLYGWLGDYIDVEIDFEHGLKRRIFIG